MALKKDNEQAISAKTLAALKSLRTNIDKLDLQRIVDENAKRGVAFTLKPNPDTSRPAPRPHNSTPPSARTPNGSDTGRP